MSFWKKLPGRIATATAGVYPNPQLGEVPVNGGGGQYQLKVTNSKDEDAAGVTITIPLDPGFYWDKAAIEKLTVTTEKWTYTLNVSWDGDALVLTFPRIDEGVNVYLQLPFKTVQTQGAQSGEVMSPPVATVVDGDVSESYCVSSS